MDFKFLLLILPIIGAFGGLAIAIVRTVGRQRQIELLQRERIAALERGVDPKSLPGLGALGQDVDGLQSGFDPSTRLQRQLLIAGVLTLFMAAGLTTVFLITEQNGTSWAIGIVPGALGLGLIVSSRLVQPRNPNR
jgi:hypothetical protein